MSGTSLAVMTSKAGEASGCIPKDTDGRMDRVMMKVLTGDILQSKAQTLVKEAGWPSTVGFSGPEIASRSRTWKEKGGGP